MTGAIRAFAPAKINLALHVTGQRDDGYHLLDSLVVFAGVGDVVSVCPADSLSLVVLDPESGALPTDGENLVVKAARFLDPDGRAAISLEKNLPTASGIGGGSSDAAATLRALGVLWTRDVGPPESALVLGADVPVCLMANPARMQGIGDILDPVPPLPDMYVVLANPRVEVATPDIFRALERRVNAEMTPVPAGADLIRFVDWLVVQRNDLQAAAISILPEIGAGLTALENTDGCLISRMSGSGATCFGIYATAEFAARAVETLKSTLPGWWLVSAPVLAPNDQRTRATT